MLDQRLNECLVYILKTRQFKRPSHPRRLAPAPAPAQLLHPGGLVGICTCEGDLQHQPQLRLYALAYRWSVLLKKPNTDGQASRVAQVTLNKLEGGPGSW